MLFFSNALRSVQVGGYVIYSTCSLSPVQNEGVVENSVAIANEYFGIKVKWSTLLQLIAMLLSVSNNNE